MKINNLIDFIINGSILLCVVSIGFVAFIVSRYNYKKYKLDNLDKKQKLVG